SLVFSIKPTPGPSIHSSPEPRSSSMSCSSSSPRTCLLCSIPTSQQPCRAAMLLRAGHQQRTPVPCSGPRPRRPQPRSTRRRAISHGDHRDKASPRRPSPFSSVLLHLPNLSAPSLLLWSGASSSAPRPASRRPCSSSRTSPSPHTSASTPAGSARFPAAPPSPWSRFPVARPVRSPESAVPLLPLYHAVAPSFPSLFPL
uniref:Uncharacterized protein n=1 Tax=Aegilops tauschii subsp. strangulata TaxID=200361 RepID=A0A452Y925_AEGTS